MKTSEQILKLGLLGSNLMELWQKHSELSTPPFTDPTIEAVEQDLLTEMKRIAADVLDSLEHAPQEPHHADHVAPEPKTPSLLLDSALPQTAHST
ncbi:MAG: hypothetical protein Q4A03_02420 [Rothia sp. (in: high G+C Gram-positive bacteria)]|uniref:hypothetical protein n=1 Tax=Rothia sp. (in: high G+C Gram-positive bacteria) TaxID=1885016 RepID=UPI0027034191|nr:hypothetical protein [Rothia sp. (in: high G+C Gram-positive bacteria)]